MSVSEYDYYSQASVEWYLIISLLTFYSVAGIAGNTLVLYVFSCRSDSLVSSLFIVALAVADLTTCLLVIPGTVYMEYWHYWITSDAFCKAYYFLVTSTILYSATVMVAIAIDRYFCLCHPWKQALTKERAKLLVVSLACLSVAHGLVMACGNGVNHDYPELESFNCSLENVRKALRDSEHFASAVVFKCLQSENATGGSDFFSSLLRETCQENFLLVSKSFMFHYKRIVMLVFGLCLVVVLFLYVAIYRSVTTRRVKRIRNRRLGTQPTLVVALPKQSTSVGAEGVQHAKGEELGIVALPCDGQESVNLTTSAVPDRKTSGKTESQASRPSALEIHISENLKIAFMLFIVTVVFVMSFLPAILILLKVVSHVPLVFYLYFVNNISNPVIYSFLNVNFRNKLKQLLCYRAGSLRKSVCIF